MSLDLFNPIYQIFKHIVLKIMTIDFCISSLPSSVQSKVEKSFERVHLIEKINKHYDD